MKTISEEMDKLVEDAMNLSIRPKLTYTQTQQLTRKWIEAVGDHSHCDNDPRMRLAFTVGWMSTTIVDLLTGTKTKKDVISDMERLTRL